MNILTRIFPISSAFFAVRLGRKWEEKVVQGKHKHAHHRHRASDEADGVEHRPVNGSGIYGEEISRLDQEEFSVKLKGERGELAPKSADRRFQPTGDDFWAKKDGTTWV